MGIFDQPGEYDESSFWYLLRSREDRALDLAVKANRRLASLQGSIGGVAVPAPAGGASEARLVELERRTLALALYARTLLAVLLDKGLLSVEEFQAKLQELDLLDGKLDGQ